MHTHNVVKLYFSRLLLLISIPQAHLIKFRLELVFDQIAAGAIGLVSVVFMQLAADFIVSMVGVVLILIISGQPLLQKKVW